MHSAAKTNRGGGILFKYVKKEVVVGCVIGLDLVNKSNVGWEIMVLLHGE
jgi:hypothetical protein